MQLSVVIAAHNDPLGLYLTTYSVLQQLRSQAIIDYEVIIVADGGTEYKWEKEHGVRCLRVRTGSPQGTRSVGIMAAKFPRVLCIESHVVVQNIIEWLDRHNEVGATLSFSARVGEGPELFRSYGYTQNWDRRFWYDKVLYNLRDPFPHKIAGFGHAAFMIDRAFYIAHGGYCMEMQGWGGEEPDLNLLVWHMGGSVWMIPQASHAHYLTPGAHGGVANDDNFKRNFCIAAYEHGGPEALAPVQAFHQYRLQINEAIQKRREAIVQGPFHGDLKLLRAYLRDQGIE